MGATSMVWFLLYAVGLLSAAPTYTRDGSMLPRPPYENGCRILFNEINLFAAQGQFIELIYTCDSAPKQTTNTINMDKFKLVIVNHLGFLLGMCQLTGRMSMVDKSLYVLGSNVRYPNANFLLDGCEIAGSDLVSEKQLSVGEDFPMALILLYNPKASVLSKIKLENDGIKYRAAKLSKSNLKTLVRNLQDYYLIASSSPYIFCKFFAQFYQDYEPQDPTNPVLRDWNGEDEDDDADRSLNRCIDIGEQNNNPMQLNLWKYATPSPGTANLCHLSYELENIDRQRPLLVGEDCYSYYGTALSRQEFFANPNNFQDELDIAEQNAVQLQIEDTMTTEAFELYINRTAPWNKPDCGSFPQNTLERIQNLPYSPLRVTSFLRVPTCSWFDYITEVNKFRCKFCHVLLQQRLLVDRPGSKELVVMARKGSGQGNVVNENQAIRARNNNDAIIVKHEQSVVHQVALDFANLVDNGKRGDDLLKEFHRNDGPLKQYYLATENLIASAIQSVKMGISFRSHRLMLDLLKYFNVQLGHLYHNERSLGKISNAIGESLHSDLIAYLKSNKPAISIQSDASTDVAGVATLAVLFQFMDISGNNNVYLYKLLPIIDRETGKNFLDSFLAALREDNLLEFVQQHVVSIATDGGSSVVKFKNSFNRLCNHEVIDVWCHNHLLELSVKKAHGQFTFLVDIDAFVNKLSKFMSKRSAFRNNVLRAVFGEKRLRVIGFKKIRAIRWLAHKYSSTVPILSRYEPIVQTLERIQNTTTASAKAKNESEVLLQTLKDPCFLVTLAYSADVIKTLAQTSLTFQLKGKSIIESTELINKLNLDLEELKQTHGDNVLNLLAASKFVNVENEQNVTLDDFQERQVRVGEITLNEPDCESVGNINTLISEFISAIIKEITQRFPVDTYSVFRVLLPLHIPINLNTIQNYGREQIESINRRFRWGYDRNQLHADWVNVLTNLINHESFDEMTATTAETFWLFFLNDATVNWGVHIRSFIQKCLSVPLSSAAAESVYSQYTYLKDRKRYSLSANSVQNMIRIRYNGYKALQDYDMLSIVKHFLTTHSRSDDTTRAGAYVHTDDEDFQEDDQADDEDDQADDEDDQADDDEDDLFDEEMEDDNN